MLHLCRAGVYHRGFWPLLREIRTRDQLARARATHKALTQGFLNKTLFATSVSRKNLETG